MHSTYHFTLKSKSLAPLFFFFFEKQDYLDLFKSMIISLDMYNPYYPACTHEDISMSNFVVSRCSNQIDIYLKLL